FDVTTTAAPPAHGMTISSLWRRPATSFDDRTSSTVTGRPQKIASGFVAAFSREATTILAIARSSYPNSAAYRSAIMAYPPFWATFPNGISNSACGDPHRGEEAPSSPQPSGAAGGGDGGRGRVGTAHTTTSHRPSSIAAAARQTIPAGEAPP